MSLYENQVKKYEDSNFKIKPGKFLEILYLPIFAILFFIFEFKIKANFINEEIADKIEFACIAFLIGLIHFFASNVLSYLYNLQRIITPFLFPPIATPKRLKIIGGSITIISIFFGFFVLISGHN